MLWGGSPFQNSAVARPPEPGDVFEIVHVFTYFLLPFRPALIALARPPASIRLLRCAIAADLSPLGQMRMCGQRPISLAYPPRQRGQHVTVITAADIESRPGSLAATCCANAGRAHRADRRPRRPKPRSSARHNSNHTMCWSTALMWRSLHPHGLADISIPLARDIAGWKCCAARKAL